jgi:uncharacterized protein YkwD
VKRIYLYRVMVWLSLFLPVGLPPLHVAAQSASPTTGPKTVYIPQILFQPIAAYELNTAESALEQFLLTYPGQQRPTLLIDITLAQVARQHAEDMANRDYCSHTTPDGYGPNYLVRAAGYPLPAEYSQSERGNNIESIACGQDSAQQVWNQLINSGAHRRHLLGQSDMYRQQIDYGIGFAYRQGATYEYYWVIITAKKALPNE